MKPITIAFANRVVLILGTPVKLSDVRIANSSRGNLVLVKSELDS